MGKLRLILNQQRLMDIYKEPSLMSYRKGNTLRTHLLELSAWVVCCPSPIFKPGNLRCVKFDSMLSRLSPTKGVKGDPRGLQCMSIFPSPHPLSSRKLKKALKLPSHRYLPTPTTFLFHFYFSPYFFRPFLPLPYCVPPPPKMDEDIHQRSISHREDHLGDRETDDRQQKGATDCLWKPTP